MKEFLEFAVDAARASGKILLDAVGTQFKIEKKGEIDLVTEVDRRIEAEIVGRIKKSYPSHRILAEEGGVINQGGDHRWIIDPLDGTTNFAHGYPCYCISIALEIKGELTVGVILDPNRNELFTACAGEGVFLNGKRVQVSKARELTDSLLVTGFAYDVRSNSSNLKEFSGFIMKTQGVRRDGSAALDLAYLSCGRFDGFWEFNLKPWDMAAGVLMVREAGGRVSAMDGGVFDLHARNLLASNALIHEQMLEVLQDLAAQ